MKQDTTFVALDVHKREHLVAMLLPGHERAETWRIESDAASIRRMVKRIHKAAPGAVAFCYEAGPTGFDLQRQMSAMGEECQVIAPSLIPSKPGDRVKTDRRDAANLAPLFRAGLLTVVPPPTVEEEQVRDLCRCREAAQKDLLRARHRLQKWLLRHGWVYRDGNHWTRKHGVWLRALKFASPRDGMILGEYLTEVEHQQERVDRLTQEMERVAQTEPYAEPVGFLRCFRGIDTITALSLVTELYDFKRFASPRELMSFVGLIPSEHTTGDKQRRGGITRTGNGRVRRLLVESSWHQWKRPVISQALRTRRKGQPAWVVRIADRAMHRLHKRYWHLSRRGKPPATAVVAVARELAGFIWAVLHSDPTETTETEKMV